VYGDARNTMAGVLPLSKEEQKKKAKLDKGFTRLELRYLRISSQDRPPSSTDPGSTADSAQNLTELFKTGLGSMVELLSNNRRLKEESKFSHGIMGDLVEAMLPNEVHPDVKKTMERWSTIHERSEKGIKEGLDKNVEIVRGFPVLGELACSKAQQE